MLDNLEVYRKIFAARKDVNFIELDTYRLCTNEYPYNHNIFSTIYCNELKSNLLVCADKSITRITFDDLPFMTYIDRHLKMYVTTSVRYMFKDCTHLKSVESGVWNLSYVTDFYGMFANCVSVTKIVTVEWIIKESIDISYMFNNCVSLGRIYLTGFKNAKIRNACYIFANCYNLQIVEHCNWTFEPIADMSGMFLNTFNIDTVNVINKWDIKHNSEVVIKDMFTNSKLQQPYWYKNIIVYRALVGID